MRGGGGAYRRAFALAARRMTGGARTWLAVSGRFMHVMT